MARRRQPESRLIYSLPQLCHDFGLRRDWVQVEVKAGRFPQPMNADLSRDMWRWSRKRMFAYLNGAPLEVAPAVDELEQRRREAS